MADINKISPYIKEAFSLLEKVNTAITQEHDSLLNRELTPKQLLILRTVRDEEMITVNFLADKLSISPSSVSQIINRLEAGKYVNRAINLNNRREIFITLGEQGVKLFEEYSKIDDYIIEKYYAGFSLEEVIIFRNLVKKLNNTVERYRG